MAVIGLIEAVAATPTVATCPRLMAVDSAAGSSHYDGRRRELATVGVVMTSQPWPAAVA